MSTQYLENDYTAAETEECPACDGNGGYYTFHGFLPCSRCLGSGRIIPRKFRYRR